MFVWTGSRIVCRHPIVWVLYEYVDWSVLHGFLLGTTYGVGVEMLPYIHALAWLEMTAKQRCGCSPYAADGQFCGML
jgi:hypothetical protein